MTHATTLADLFHNKLQQKEKNFPQICWIPKLHKTPYKARFIAVSCSCSTTRLSKSITERLQLARSHCTAYCKTIRKRTGVNSMWIINNSFDVIHALEEKQVSLTHVSTWESFLLFIPAFHTPNLKTNFRIFWKEFFIRKRRGSLLPIIFAPSGQMIGCPRGTHTSLVESSALLLTSLSTAFTFVLKLCFPAGYWYTNGHQ